MKFAPVPSVNSTLGKFFVSLTDDARRSRLRASRAPFGIARRPRATGNGGKSTVAR